MTIALYPGSFDPITNGHIDIIERASNIFDKLVIAIYDRPDKNILFSATERVDLVKKAVTHINNVEVQSYSGLTVTLARNKGAKVVVRGLRMITDFEHEFEMAMMNKKLDPSLELVCFMASLQYEFLSSSVIKEVAQLDGCLDGLVPEHVLVALKDKFLK